MKRYRVAITEPAADDLRELARGWEIFVSLEDAARWTVAIEDLIASLGEDPTRHPLAHRLEHLPGSIREIGFGIGKRKGRATHRILFTVTETEVRVLRIRAAAQRDLRGSELGK